MAAGDAKAERFCVGSTMASILIGSPSACFARQSLIRYAAPVTSRMAETDETLTEPQSPARRRFAVARLAGAVRRQDWLTVVVEIAVVVIGVVIGFQVTAWGKRALTVSRSRPTSGRWRRTCTRPSG